MKKTFRGKKRLGKTLVYLAVAVGLFVFAPSLNSDEFEMEGLYFQNFAEEETLPRAPVYVEKSETEKTLASTQSPDKKIEPDTIQNIVYRDFIGDLYNYEKINK